MRDGYILLHRQGLTPEEWKNPRRTLAWIDLLTLTNYQDCIVTVSYGFLAKRWRVSKDTAYQWIRHWIAERQIERLPERSTERNAERFFVLNYAKYQRTAERISERQAERSTERQAEPMYKDSSSKSVESIEKNHTGIEKKIVHELRRYDGIGNPESYLASLKSKASDQAIKKAWSEWIRGCGIESPAAFWARGIHWHKAMSAKVAK